MVLQLVAIHIQKNEAKCPPNTHSKLNLKYIKDINPMVTL